MNSKDIQKMTQLVLAVAGLLLAIQQVRKAAASMK